MNKILLTILALASFSTISQAACTRADLTGRWVIFTDDSAMQGFAITRCAVVFPATGSTSTAATCTPVGYPAKSAVVTIAINSACDVSGRLAISTLGTTNFIAALNSSKNVMSGGWYYSKELGGSLTGTK
jgi:hypothetical protein